MLLIRTIILKCTLTICSASVLDVINLKVSKRDRSGMSTTSTVWLTENRPFNFHIESDADIQDFGCTFGRKSQKSIHYQKQPEAHHQTESVYAPWNTIKTSVTMKGIWNCRVYFQGTDANVDIIIKVEVDVDECNATPDPCSNNADCTNTLGSYNCTCFPGYTGDGKYCEDVDECNATPYPCLSNADCINTPGSYRCICLPGYTGDGNHCHAVDPCKPNPCHAKEICIDQKPGFRCECPSGFTSDGHSCSAPDPCQSNPCHAKATCSRVNYHPGFNCECIKGYEGDGHRCRDMDECHFHPCHPQAECVYTYPNHSCHCHRGFTGDGYSSCSDIDECRDKVCHGYRTCTNTPGSFYCECLPGYHNNTNERCEDIDECHLNKSDCKNGERCWNTNGSFKCCPSDQIFKNGYCICPDHYINYDELGCVYDQCLNTSCGVGAMCKMINAQPHCQCPNDTTGDPYEECAVLAEPGPSPNRGSRGSSTSLKPSIDILIYVSKTGLKHFTTVNGLILDQNFTISVGRKDVNFTITEKQTITCYKKENRTIIHLNELKLTIAGSKYITMVPKASASMNGNWKCLIKTKTYADVVKSKGPTKPSSIAIEFPVTIKEARVTELPIKSDVKCNKSILQPSWPWKSSAGPTTALRAFRGTGVYHRLLPDSGLLM